MNDWRGKKKLRFLILWLVLPAIAAGMFLHARALAQTSSYNVTVVDQAGTSISGFRWLLQEDTDKNITPGVYMPPDQTVRLSNHKSYAPVVDSGENNGGSATINVPDGTKRYFLSVLPYAGHALSGASLSGKTNVTVVCQKHPLPTSQISVLAFRDINPINNSPDTGEPGIAGFQVKLYDQFGEMLFDGFGNPLGTSYRRNPDGSAELDGDGNAIVDQLGSGVYTGADGLVIIKNLVPGKYGIRVVPRETTIDGEVIDPNRWTQTATIEGTPTVDAWVEANNPPFFVEFGTAFHHVFLGFVLTDDPIVAGNASTGVYNGLYKVPNPSGVTGTITGKIINVHQSRPPVTTVNEGVPVPEAWIGLNVIEGGAAGQGVYTAQADSSGGFRVEGVPAGTYQLVVWDKPLNQIVSFHTVIVPAQGGDVDMGKLTVNAWFGRLEGYVFHDWNENGFRDNVEKGLYGQAVNLRFRDGSMYQATTTGLDGSYSLNGVFPWFHWIVAEVDFLRFKATGATFVTDDGGPIPPHKGWSMPSDGKRNPQKQADGKYFRTEKGPVLTQAMLLYADQNHRIDWGKKNYGPGPDGIYGTADDENGGITGIVFYDSTRAEDDPRFNAPETWQPGIPNVRVNLYRVDGRDANNKPTQLTMVNSTLTDSWDNSMPKDCPGNPQFDPFGGLIDSCAEYLRTWNQLRPGVFDGGYAFEDFYPGGIQVDGNGKPVLDQDGNPVPVIQSEQPRPLLTGNYVVEVVRSKGYELVKEEDKNVAFGDRYIPAPAKLPPVCVGSDRVVPAELSLFPGEPTFYAGQTRPLCDRKEVVVTSNLNAAADFFLFTYVPVAGHFVGLNTNDLTNTFNPKDPNFGEKLFPSWIPISFKDYQGNEIVRSYTDQWGGYNAMVPGSYTANVPNPTGFGPNMMKICLNDPGPNLANPDPFHNPAYGVVCYTFDAWPGKTVLLDTPVLPVGAFTGSYQGKLDCEFPTGTPRIKRVLGGPYAPQGVETIVGIESMGYMDVTNPAYRSDRPAGPNNPPNISRDFGFGTTKGTVTLGGKSLDVVSWTNDMVKVRIKKDSATGQLVITRGDTKFVTPVGITMHVGSGGGAVHRVPLEYPTIQAAIDAANAGDLILVGGGIRPENIIMWKPVKLQGYGEGASVINGFTFTPDKQALWLAKVSGHVAAGDVSLVPGQREDFALEAGAAVTVLGRNDGSFKNGLIDGFTIMHSLTGGGVLVNGYTDGLTISNNRIAGNWGNFAGGIRAGWAPIVNQTLESSNHNLVIRNNHLNQNGSVDGGGGIALFNDTDNYVVENCYVCGNFSGFAGAGIHHFGFSPGSEIRSNKLFFNEVSIGNKPVGGQGGGILIAGENPPAGATLSPGAGEVTVRLNHLQGNAANHDGGGIAVLRFNGQDAQLNPANPSPLSILNNTIVNNVAQMAGGAISLHDVVSSVIEFNNIGLNDSTATHTEAIFQPAPLLTTPRTAGIFSRLHSAELQAITGTLFSNPSMRKNIVWRNRAFHWDDTQANPAAGLTGLVPRAMPYDYRDLGVEGDAGLLTCTECKLSIAPNPFVSPYFNRLEATNEAGEGGNSIAVILRPLTPTGDYSLR